MTRYDYLEIDNVIHSRIRLAITSILATVDEAEFSFLKKQTGATDGNLITHLRRLLAADYIEESRTDDGGRARTLYRLTSSGRSAFESYLAQLSAMLPK